MYYVDRGYIDFYVPIDGDADDGKFYEELDMNDFADYEYDEFFPEFITKILFMNLLK